MISFTVSIPIEMRMTSECRDARDQRLAFSCSAVSCLCVVEAGISMQDQRPRIANIGETASATRIGRQARHRRHNPALRFQNPKVKTPPAPREAIYRLRRLKYLLDFKTRIRNPIDRRMCFKIAMAK